VEGVDSSINVWGAWRNCPALGVPLNFGYVLRVYETHGPDRWLNISESSMKEIIRVPICRSGKQLYIVVCEH
jgi:hypothetical protein